MIALGLNEMYDNKLTVRTISPATCVQSLKRRLILRLHQGDQLGSRANFVSFAISFVQSLLKNRSVSVLQPPF